MISNVCVFSTFVTVIKSRSYVNEYPIRGISLHIHNPTIDGSGFDMIVRNKIKVVKESINGNIRVYAKSKQLIK